jgi:hypothetical protein
MLSMSLTRWSAAAALLLASLLVSLPAARAANLQDQLNASWQGARAVLLLEAVSDCGDSFTSNQVVGNRTLSSATHRLARGELVRVLKVDVKRSRIDIMISLDEPLLVSWTEGPYELFDQATCRIELEIAVPRELVKKKRLGEIESVLASLLERHESQESVAGSANWNRREVEPMPAGHDETLAEYRTWKAARLREDLATTLADALEKAQRAIDRANGGPAYGAGMAAGIEKEARRYRSWDECDELVAETHYPAGKGAPSEFEGSDKREWERGYRDGQVVAFNVELSRHIAECLEDL